MIHLKKILNKFPFVSHTLQNIFAVLRGEPTIRWKPVDFTELTKLIGKNDPIILEIGCNDGSTTLNFLQYFKKAQVYCFESDPRALERFKSKINDGRVKLFDIAISDKDGVVDFFVSSGFRAESDKKKFPQGWDQSGSIRKPKKHLKAYPWCKFDKKIKVKTKKLDTWCKENEIDSIDFIWADVQGAEIDLIRGASKALKNTHYFYIEYSNRELYEGQINLRKLLKLLPDFVVVHRYPGDILLKKT